MAKSKDETAGQTRRAADSRPRPGSKTPEAEVPHKDGPVAPPAKGDPKPSSSWSAIDPGRPVKKD